MLKIRTKLLHEDIPIQYKELRLETFERKILM